MTKDHSQSQVNNCVFLCLTGQQISQQKPEEYAKILLEIIGKNEEGKKDL